MSTISIFEEPIDMSCGHEFCRACWEGWVACLFLSNSFVSNSSGVVTKMCVCILVRVRFLNLKIQEGEAHNIFCPAYDCFQLVPVEVIESVVSREMDKRYLQFDIKVFTLSNLTQIYCTGKYTYFSTNKTWSFCQSSPSSNNQNTVLCVINTKIHFIW